MVFSIYSQFSSPFLPPPTLLLLTLGNSLGKKMQDFPDCSQPTANFSFQMSLTPVSITLPHWPCSPVCCLVILLQMLQGYPSKLPTGVPSFSRAKVVTSPLKHLQGDLV